MTLLYTLIVIPQVLAAWILLTKYGDVESCPNSLERDVSVRVWIALDSVQLLVAVALSWQVHKALRAHEMSATTEAGTEATPNEVAERRLRYWRIASFWNDLFGVLWLVKGSGVFFGEVSCQDTAPHLFPLGQTLMFISVGILALPVVACVFVALSICFCLPCLVRALVAVHGNSRRVKGATPEVLASIPTATYSVGMFGSTHTGDGSTDSEGEMPQCAICLAYYVVGENLRLLPCDERHHFHASCCDDWLKLNASCPVCRRPVGPRANAAGGAAAADGASTRGGEHDVENPAVVAPLTTTTVTPATTTTTTASSPTSGLITMV
jgi:hypothetical protein